MVIKNAGYSTDFCSYLFCRQFKHKPISCYKVRFHLAYHYQFFGVKSSITMNWSMNLLGNTVLIMSQCRLFFSAIHTKSCKLFFNENYSTLELWLFLFIWVVPIHSREKIFVTIQKTLHLCRCKRDFYKGNSIQIQATTCCIKGDQLLQIQYSSSIPRTFHCQQDEKVKTSAQNH